MIDHTLTQMDSSDEEKDSGDEDDDPTDFNSNIGGACFLIHILRDPQKNRKIQTCTRVNSLKKPHAIQIAVPETILDYYKKYSVGQVFELQTEAIIEGTRYRAHPNFRGGGPWYDFVTVEFELENRLDRYCRVTGASGHCFRPGSARCQCRGVIYPVQTQRRRSI